MGILLVTFTESPFFNRDTTMLDPLFSPYFADGDFELGGYRVQALVQQTRAAYARNAVFPHLTQVSALASAMREMLTALRSAPSDAADAQDEAPEAAPHDVLAGAEAFAEWACERLEPLVYEGETILRFAQENVHVEPVGVMPAYAREGYLLVSRRGAWRAYRFAAYVLRTPEEAALRARPVPGVEAPSPPALKRTLLARFPDLPVPATFALESEFSFPAEATLLPVAGRKLPPLIWDGRARG